MEEKKVGIEITNDETKKEEGLEITNTNVDFEEPEERPGVGYEIFNIGIGTDT